MIAAQPPSLAGVLVGDAFQGIQIVSKGKLLQLYGSMLMCPNPPVGTPSPALISDPIAALSSLGVGLHVHSDLYLQTSSNGKIYKAWDPSMVDGALLGSIGTQGVLSVFNLAVIGQNRTNYFLAPITTIFDHAVSVANTQQQIVYELRNLARIFAISMVCSGGTATLEIDGSMDGTNYLTIDSIPAAATTVKNYTPTDKGGTVAMSPLAFRYIKVTAGAAGVGNTTTLDIGAK